MGVVVEDEGLSPARAPCGEYSLVPPPPDTEGKTPPPGAGASAHPWGQPGRAGGIPQGRASGKPTSSESVKEEQERSQVWRCVYDVKS